MLQDSWACACRVAYHKDCGPPFQTCLAKDKRLIFPPSLELPYFICEACKSKPCSNGNWRTLAVMWHWWCWNMCEWLIPSAVGWKTHMVITRVWFNICCSLKRTSRPQLWILHHFLIHLRPHQSAINGPNCKPLCKSSMMGLGFHETLPRNFAVLPIGMILCTWCLHSHAKHFGKLTYGLWFIPMHCQWMNWAYPTSAQGLIGVWAGPVSLAGL